MRDIKGCVPTVVSSLKYFSVKKVISDYVTKTFQIVSYSSTSAALQKYSKITTPEEGAKPTTIYLLLCCCFASMPFFNFGDLSTI
jgi:hypothetical protein